MILLRKEAPGPPFTPCMVLVQAQEEEQKMDLQFLYKFTDEKNKSR